MIKYQLRCETRHEFEAWFRNSADFDTQAAGGLLECPHCGSAAVEKAIMAPSISTSAGSRGERLSDMRQTMAEAVRRARDYVEKHFDHVGDRFPEEARKIHYGETDPRPIYGEATPKEAKELVEEGVSIAPLPALPDDRAAPPLPKSKKPVN
jgi:hypothetical protein